MLVPAVGWCGELEPVRGAYHPPWPGALICFPPSEGGTQAAVPGDSPPGPPPQAPPCLPRTLEPVTPAWWLRPVPGGRGSRPSPLKCHVGLSPMWRRTLTFPLVGVLQSEDRSAVAPSSGPGVTTLFGCPYPSHLWAKETTASQGQRSVSGSMGAGPPMMTSGVLGSGSPQKRIRLIARPSYGDLAVQEQRPMGLD